MSERYALDANAGSTRVIQRCVYASAWSHPLPLPVLHRAGCGLCCCLSACCLTGKDEGSGDSDEAKEGR
jgi:hypothetical protein